MVSEETMPTTSYDSYVKDPTTILKPNTFKFKNNHRGKPWRDNWTTRQRRNHGYSFRSQYFQITRTSRRVWSKKGWITPLRFELKRYASCCCNLCISDQFEGGVSRTIMPLLRVAAETEIKRARPTRRNHRTQLPKTGGTFVEEGYRGWPIWQSSTVKSEGASVGNRHLTPKFVSDYDVIDVVRNRIIQTLLRGPLYLTSIQINGTHAGFRYQCSLPMTNVYGSAKHGLLTWYLGSKGSDSWEL